MKFDYDDCPICGKRLEYCSFYPGGEDRGCNNEKEIIFAKAGRKEIPEYHYFSIDSKLSGVGSKLLIQVPLSPGKIIRFVRYENTDFTSIYDRFGRSILRIPQVIEPDFPDLTKLKNKLRTYINFS